MLSPRIKRNISRVIPYGVLWFIFSVIYCILEKSILGGLDYYPSTGVQYNFIRNIAVIPLGGMLIGLTTGVLEIGYFGNWLIKKSFTSKIIIKSFIYLAIVIVFLLTITAINMVYMENLQAFADPSSPAWAFFKNYALIGVILYVASIVVIAQFYAEFSQNMGPGTLLNFFLGKYHHPVEEQRIFMFLDMKSSTTIAEKLGHVVYFQMLREYFFDLSGAVIDYAGEIYQYAGDEMIVCWKLKNGLKNNHSVACFFAMKRLLEVEGEKYNSKFGVVPDFKAGLHSGTVTAGEIGSLKKEIIYTGDVLNTTARLQGLCNHFDVELLVSDDFVRQLDLPLLYAVTPVGEHVLKGRSKPMQIFTISTER